MYVKLKLREREKLFSFFTSDSVNLLLSVINSFIAEVPIIGDQSIDPQGSMDLHHERLKNLNSLQNFIPKY